MSKTQRRNPCIPCRFLDSRRNCLNNITKVIMTSTTSLMLLLPLCGCPDSTAENLDIKVGQEGTKTLGVKADQRMVYFSKAEDRTLVCAEPAPDVAQNVAEAFSGSGKI